MDSFFSLLVAFAEACEPYASEHKLWTSVQSQEERPMKIGQLARDAAVSIDTVRFYERRGVLPRPQRQPSGYRTYSDATVGRIKLARALQALGLTLDEVIDALRAHDRG